ncbi:protein phosphatase 2C domain-containing protein [Besnoitia besnoiti]|uniref:Protein phosphatase 2C domain-containing protein n=1 Tax=Besnoitia besnoiti TaxID=94643 RepID=A0A2A9M5F4_BESBE|nr:protein phosphatase 2C domain-containing protein [Besnoitia besnoiti]PFH31126.1 protein phosphatase 2C domain-containing protein [Besnoitia besnoiti]
MHRTLAAVHAGLFPATLGGDAPPLDSGEQARTRPRRPFNLRLTASHSSFFAPFSRTASPSLSAPTSAPFSSLRRRPPEAPRASAPPSSSSHSFSGASRLAASRPRSPSLSAGGDSPDAPWHLRQFNRRAALASPSGGWRASFNVFPATKSRYAFADFSADGVTLCDGIGGPRASSFVSQNFFSLLEETRRTSGDCLSCSPSSSAATSCCSPAPSSHAPSPCSCTSSSSPLASPTSTCSCFAEGNAAAGREGGRMAAASGEASDEGKSRSVVRDFSTLNVHVREKHHASLIRELDRHFYALEDAFASHSRGDARLAREGSSVCSAFLGSPLGLLVCTLGDVGAVLVVREGETARRNAQRREQERCAPVEPAAEAKDKPRAGAPAGALKKEIRIRQWTPTRGFISAEEGDEERLRKARETKRASEDKQPTLPASPTSPSSSSSPSATSFSSSLSSSSSRKDDFCLPLVAWRLADPHNTENGLVDEHFLLKGFTQATRAIGALHLKNHAVNAQLPSELRAKHVARRDAPYLSSRPDYTLQPFHADVGGVILGSSGFWQLLSPEEAAALLDIFLTCQHAAAAQGKEATHVSSADGQAEDDAATFLLRAALTELFCRHKRSLRSSNLTQRAMEAAGLPHWDSTRDLVLERQAILGDRAAQLEMIKQLEVLHRQRPDDHRRDFLRARRRGLINSDVAVCVVLRDSAYPPAAGEAGEN